MKFDMEIKMSREMYAAYEEYLVQLSWDMIANIEVVDWEGITFAVIEGRIQ